MLIAFFSVAHSLSGRIQNDFWCGCLKECWWAQRTENIVKMWRVEEEYSECVTNICTMWIIILSKISNIMSLILARINCYQWSTINRLGLCMCSFCISVWYWIFVFRANIQFNLNIRRERSSDHVRSFQIFKS